jgi:hypothetical protein
LHRLGHRLAAALGDEGTAYRFGGDEFCLLSTAPDTTGVLARASRALSETGERFAVHSSYGSTLLTGADAEPADALRLADQRMYANKRGGRRSTDETVHQVLLRVAAEHDGELSDHVNDVADLVDAVGRTLGLDPDTLLEARRPPPCTTSARSRSPTPSCTPARARRRRVGIHAPAHDHRSADHRRRARAPQRRRDRALEP